MKYIIVIIFLILFSTQAQALDELDYADFGRIPIVYAGRVMPMDSFAKDLLTSFSGGSRLSGESANSWLAQSIFSPQEVVDKPVFLVQDEQIRSMLALQDRKNHLYSFNEISQPLDSVSAQIEQLGKIPPQKLNDSQRNLLDLYRHASDEWELLRSLTLVIPLGSDFSSDNVNKNYLNLFSQINTLEQLAKHDKDSEKTLRMMKTVEAEGINSKIFRVISPQWETLGDEWLSPWAVLSNGSGSPATSEYLDSYKNLAIAYHSGDRNAWQSAAKDTLDKAKILSAQHTKFWKINLELCYNLLAPFTVALGLYIASFLVIYLSKKSKIYACPLYAAAWFCHLCGVLMRITILGRPPVATLYESIIFVSLAISTICLLLNKTQIPSKRIGAIISSVGLLISFAFVPKDDSFGVLVAVLNTNFWLATHVICITLGYSLCILCSGLAHAYLWQKKSAGDGKALFSLTHNCAIISLSFTTIGTILGGIWADQSWGRFWGWDPKENGALLIIIWISWALHGRLSGHLRQRGYAICLSLLSVIVAFSWLGVNLLGVGLHSYGFTNQAAYGLFAFSLTEIAIIAYLALRKGNEYA